MKITLTFKTPDVIENSLRDLELSDEEKQSITERLEKRINYGEYCVLEYDTEKDTLRLLCGD